MRELHGEKVDVVRWSEDVGQLIQNNAEVCARIRDALNIKKRYQLDRPYDDLVSKHLEAAD